MKFPVYLHGFQHPFCRKSLFDGIHKGDIRRGSATGSAQAQFFQGGLFFQDYKCVNKFLEALGRIQSGQVTDGGRVGSLKYRLGFRHVHAWIHHVHPVCIQPHPINHALGVPVTGGDKAGYLLRLFGHGFPAQVCVRRAHGVHPRFFILQTAHKHSVQRLAQRRNKTQQQRIGNMNDVRLFLGTQPFHKAVEFLLLVAFRTFQHR